MRCAREIFIGKGKKEPRCLRKSGHVGWHVAYHPSGMRIRWRLKKKPAPHGTGTGQSPK